MTHTVKHLRRMLKQAGLKTTGRKAALTRRAKKAGLKGGQLSEVVRRTGDTAKDLARGVVNIGEAAVLTPFRGVRAAIGARRGGFMDNPSGNVSSPPPAPPANPPATPPPSSAPNPGGRRRYSRRR